MQGRIFVWTDETGAPVSPEQMDIHQMLEYVMSTVYGEEGRPKANEIEGKEGFRFASESAFADGTPCTMEICLLRGEAALYYLEIQGGAEQTEAVKALTDAILTGLSLK